MKRRERESERECTRDSRRAGEKESRGVGERPLALWLLFLCFFLPLGLPYVNWASQKCCLFCLRSSLWSLDLPLFYFHRLFPFLSFSHRHSGLLFSYSNYLEFPPKETKGLILWEYGCRGLSDYFLLNWDYEGHWASLSC